MTPSRLRKTAYLLGFSSISCLVSGSLMLATAGAQKPLETGVVGAAGLAGGPVGAQATTTTMAATTTMPATTTTVAPKQLNPFKVRLVKTFGNRISPKSVVAGPNGLVIAQNMMYTHGISVYTPTGKSVTRISDTVSRKMLGLKGGGKLAGSPVEAAFTPDGKYAWVTNYQMIGPGFTNPGNDDCPGETVYDPSWVYKVDMEKFKVVDAVKVGEVPKFVAVSPDGRLVLVSNWCGYTLTVIDAATSKVITTLKTGRFPRGIAITKDSSRAYVTVQGASRLAVVNLRNFSIKFWRSAASSARHALLSPDDKILYVSHNLSSLVTSHDARTGRVLKRLVTGTQPRSMAMSPDGRAIYVVNYVSATLSVVSTKTMKVVQTLPTGHHPVGITYEPTKNRVWVACYSGLLQMFALTEKK